MVGTIQIKCSARNPSMPLCPVFAFQDSYQQVRISDVPKRIGDWSIKRVEVECLFPDNHTMRFDGELVGGVWVATISACPIAGTSKNGFVVNGYDENGNKYVLGKSDLYIITNDSRIVPQKEIQLVNILPNKPDAPHVGDAVFVDGKFEIYDGETWVSTGSSDGYTKEETDNAISSALSAKEDAKYIESEDGKRRIYGNGDVYNLSSAPGTYGPWTDANGNTRTDLQVKLVDPNVPTYIWSNSTLSFFSVAFNSLEEAETATEFEEAIPNRGDHWTRTYTPGTEEWVKEDELSLKSDFDSIATTYATKDELPTKTSQLENDSGFISGGDIPTKTSQLVNDSDFATNASVDEKIGGVTSSIPTKTSQLDNDSNFATNASVDEKIGGVTSSIPTKTSELQNDSEFTDKNFVNSSIATNTANFKGTFNNESEFPNEATNNDYLFLNTVDENGNTIYKRYKYIASTSTWTYEYTLNNSSFTAEQWATINGGPYASTTDIPTKTSELENDSGFITNKQVKPGETTGFAANSEQANMAIRANQADSVDWDGVNGRPTKLSQFDNDSGYVTRTGTVASAMYATNANSADSARSADSVMWSGVNNTPTTLEGYGITDAATNASVDEKIGGVTSSIPTKTSQLDNDSNFATKTYVDEHAGNASNCVKLNETNEISQYNSVIFHVNDNGTYSTGIKIFMNNDLYGILIADKSIGLCHETINNGWQYKLEIPEEDGTIATRQYVDNKLPDKIKLTIFQDMSVDSATHDISILQNYQDNTSINVKMNPDGMTSGYDIITLDIPLVSGTTFSDTYPNLINIGAESTGGSWYMQIGDKYGNIQMDSLGNCGTTMLDNIVYAKVFNRQ